MAYRNDGRTTFCTTCQVSFVAGAEADHAEQNQQRHPDEAERGRYGIGFEQGKEGEFHVTFDGQLVGQGLWTMDDVFQFINRHAARRRRQAAQ
jgi:hypothetical protein